MAVSQLIKTTLYQYKMQAIGCIICGLTEALKVQNILGYH